MFTATSGTLVLLLLLVLDGWSVQLVVRVVDIGSERKPSEIRNEDQSSSAVDVEEAGTGQSCHSRQGRNLDGALQIENIRHRMIDKISEKITHFNSW